MAATFWLYSHNFTHSGAPLVLAAIARELAEAGWRERLRVLSWGGVHDRRHSTLQNELQADGIHCEILDLHQPAPRPHKEDRLLLNSLALPETVIRNALLWLQQGRLKRLDWFAHEANPEIWLTHPDQQKRLKMLLENKNFHLRVPSQFALKRYQNWLGYFGNQLNYQIPKLCFDNKDESLIDTPAPSFDTLHYQITAMAGAGQKGHLWLLRVLEQVIAQPDAKKSHLRPIELSFIGLEKGPYAALAREIIRCAQALLGDSFHWTYHGSKSDALGAMVNANMAVCCSLEETFSLVSAEAMALGQPLLRTRTGGWSEQLDPGINGFDLGLPGPEVRLAHVDLLRQLRDPEIFSNERLKQMSHAARAKAQTFRSVTYCDWLLGE